MQRSSLCTFHSKHGRVHGPPGKGEQACASTATLIAARASGSSARRFGASWALEGRRTMLLRWLSRAMFASGLNWSICMRGKSMLLVNTEPSGRMAVLAGRGVTLRPKILSSSQRTSSSPYVVLFYSYVISRRSFRFPSDSAKARELRCCL